MRLTINNKKSTHTKCYNEILRDQLSKHDPHRRTLKFHWQTVYLKRAWNANGELSKPNGKSYTTKYRNYWLLVKKFMHKECKCKEFYSQTRLGGEICSSDVNTHEGYYSAINNLAVYRKGPFLSWGGSLDSRLISRLDFTVCTDSNAL